MAKDAWTGTSLPKPSFGMTPTVEYYSVAFRDFTHILRSDSVIPKEGLDGLVLAKPSGVPPDLKNLK